MMKPTNNPFRTWILLTISTFFFLFIYAYTLDHKLDLNGDNAVYISLARNMASGVGYASQTIDGIQPASHFPPGYSAILSVFIWMGIDNLIFFKWLNALFCMAGIGLLYWIFNRILQQNYLSFVIALLTTMSINLLHFAGMAMSEMSYMFCLIFSMFALYQYSESEQPYYKNVWFYLAFIMAVASYYIRSVGTSIMFGLLVFYLFRKEWKQAAVSLAGMAVLVAPWMIRNKLLGLESRYFGTIMTVNPWRPEQGTISSFSEMWDKMLVNIDDTVIKGFREVLFPFWQVPQEPSTPWGIIVGLLIVAIVFYGAWNSGKWRWMMMAFLAANIGIFALWHGGNGSRYVTPIIPIIFYCFYTGIYSVVQLILRNRLKEHTLLALLLLLILPSMKAPVEQLHKQSAQKYMPNYRNYFQLAKWAEKECKGSVIVSRKPELFGYYAPHVFHTRYIFDTCPDSVIADFVYKKVDYVVLEQLGYSSTGLYLYPALRAKPHLFPIIQELSNPSTYLLKFNREQAAEELHITLEK